MRERLRRLGRCQRPSAGARALLLAGALALAPAGAAADDAYVIGGIHVDETADTAEDARELAHRAGERIAFDRLLRRMLLESDVLRVPPEVRTDPLPYVTGFSVHGERIGPSTYRARMEVRFDPEAVRELLGGLGIPFEERRPPPMLVVPVYGQGGGLALWDNNPWLAAWVRRTAGADLGALRLPHGEAEDVAALNAEAAVAGDEERIARLGDRYGIDHVAVAVARSAPGRRAGIVDVETRLLRRGRASGAPFAFRLTAAPDETFADFLDRAVSASARVVGDLWIAEAQARQVPDGTFNVRADYDGFAGWRAIRAAIARADPVAGHGVLLLGPRRAELRLDYHDSPAAVRRALQEEGIEVRVTDGTWTLALPRAPAAETAPAEPPAAPAAPEEAPAPTAPPPPVPVVE